MIKNSIKMGLSSLMVISMAHAETTYGSVNGETITKDEIIQVMGPQGSQIDTLDAATKKRVINIVIDRKVLSQHASTSGMEKTEEYQKELARVKQELMLNVWMKQENTKLENAITDKDLKAYFDEHKGEYSTPAELKARHILVKTEDEAKALIKSISEAKETKAEFIKLAKEKSTGPSGKDGGDLGWFSLDKMVPEFSKAADKLKKGEFTKTAVKTQFGYHLIMLDDRKEAGVADFDTKKEEIKSMLSRDKFNTFMETTVADLKKKAKIVMPTVTEKKAESNTTEKK